MKKRTRKIIGFSVVIIVLLSLVTLLFFVNPEELVRKIGVRNEYILAFVVSFFGGFSAGGSFSFIGLLITLVAGGLHPISLGVIAGISLAIGDTLMFYIGSQGRQLVEGDWDKKIAKIAKIFEKRAWLKKLTPLIAYLYMGFLPLPNDILILFLAAIKYPPRKMNCIIIAGDITFALMITLLAAKGITLFA